MERPRAVERRLGHAKDGQGRFVRVVERAIVHGVPVDFRTLVDRVVPTTTRYLVLDLDRTLHLGRNMGELLGFAICAHLAYGDRAKGDGRGRFAVPLGDVRGTLAYLSLGAQMWAMPGLFYLVWAKLARLTQPTRRLAFRIFGPEPVRLVQSIPQTTLLHQLATLPKETLRELAREVWRRHESDLVLGREDIAYLRARCPGLTIILTSASPAPMVEIAAEELGIDEVDYTASLGPSGAFAAPFGPGWVARRAAHPDSVAPPSRVRINSSYAKIEGLLARHPDIGTGEAITVGITDTGYGEDHCFGEFFTHVVDVNSNAPFSPIAPATSPLREVHSAHVLSHHELARRRIEPGYLAPSRSVRPSGRDVELGRDELVRALSDVLARIEQAAARYDASRRGVLSARDELARHEDIVLQRVEALVSEYNRADGTLRDLLLAELDAISHSWQRMARIARRIERPVSAAAFELTTLLEEARARIEPTPV